MLNNQLTLFDQISNSENLDCQTNHIEPTKERFHFKPTVANDENSLDHPSCLTLLEYGERRASSMWSGLSHRRAALRSIMPPLVLPEVAPNGGILLFPLLLILDD